MHVLISGASGLVGSALTSLLQANGHRVTRLVRWPPGENEVRWYPERGVFYETLVDEVDGVVNLSGESIAEGRWTAAKKKRILDSRLKTTSLLAESLTRLDPVPKVWVSASAVGFYGDRGAQIVDEADEAGSGYLADVCQQWEAATRPAAEAGIRVVNLRIGVVLSRKGGALKKMLLPFRLGGGGIVGSGRQYWSWVALAELVQMIEYCLLNESLTGPVNGVTDACTNLEFTKALGKVLKRPTIMPLPGFAAKLVLGEMAQALLLASTRVAPTKLRESGYEFRHTDIESALRAALND